MALPEDKPSMDAVSCAIPGRGLSEQAGHFADTILKAKVRQCHHWSSWLMMKHKSSTAVSSIEASAWRQQQTDFESAKIRGNNIKGTYERRILRLTGRMDSSECAGR